MEKRDGIQRGEASLLDLRSYLFSRQCTLLIFLQRPWEVTQRALELLHNCVQELRLLEVNTHTIILSPCCDGWIEPKQTELNLSLIILYVVALVVQVSVLEGALDCWVFLSCLEVLHRIEGCCDQAQLAANCSHTVGLWAYATDKVTKILKHVALISGVTSNVLMVPSVDQHLVLYVYIFDNLNLKSGFFFCSLKLELCPSEKTVNM